jgi:hypothetical protein
MALADYASEGDFKVVSEHTSSVLVSYFPKRQWLYQFAAQNGFEFTPDNIQCIKYNLYHMNGF